MDGRAAGALGLADDGAVRIVTDSITEHFSLEEFRCHNGDPYPRPWIEPRLRPLCIALEAIRAACGGRVVHVLSGYRSPDYNEALRLAGHGVAKDSQHMHGRAADIAVEVMSPAEVQAVVHGLVEVGTIQIGGLGRYQGWVHVDVRPGPLVQWVA